ncbi:hypothetical protein ACFX5K_02820 [Rickettsiales bacterium LUAb2]
MSNQQHENQVNVILNKLINKQEFSELSVIEKINVLEKLTVEQLIKLSKNKSLDINKFNSNYNKNIKLLLEIIKLRITIETSSNNSQYSFDNFITMLEQ